jgi:hypothetical protein
MAQSLISYFVDDAALAALDTRVPGAADVAVAGTVNGMNVGASNAPGIGISTENPDLDESLPNWTLLDQHGNARDAQISQLIGGNGLVARTGNVATTWDTTQALYTPSGAASSGGTEGTAPDATIRMGTNPTQAAKDAAEPSIDGTIIADNSAVLLDLDVGWTSAVPTP